ncbi:MAG: hypothetical protein A2Z34_08555 [Planctomycetes bacterium RBG_16_59_8]|nr:MAG: hypothetical protein A2Z34_08555 [Planctomycetes bacterium RBG_16_59_8]
MFFFDTRKQLADYCQTNKITLYSPMGFYHPGKKIGYFTRSPFGLLSIVYHEIIHQLEYNMPGMTIDFLKKRREACTWTEEGFANYVETVLMEGDAKYEGKKAPCLAKIGQFIPLKKFCSLNYGDMEKLDPAVKCGMYITVFHYFMHAANGAYREKFVKHALLGGKAAAEDLESLLGVSLDTLQADYIAHARKLLSPTE